MNDCKPRWISVSERLPEEWVKVWSLDIPDWLKILLIAK